MEAACVNYERVVGLGLTLRVWPWLYQSQLWQKIIIASLLTSASDIPSRSSLRSSSIVTCSYQGSVARLVTAFSVAAHRAWNRLPTDLKLLRSTASFKNKLKSFLFHATYTENTLWALECAIGLIVGGAPQVTVVTVTVTVYHLELKKRLSTSVLI